VIARYERTDGNRIHVRCEVRDEARALVGEGSTEQVVLPRDSLDRRFAR
jgi:predicted thioesterase